MYIYIHVYTYIYIYILTYIEGPSADAADLNPAHVTPPGPSPGDVREFPKPMQ